MPGDNEGPHSGKFSLKGVIFQRQWLVRTVCGALRKQCLPHLDLPDQSLWGGIRFLLTRSRGWPAWGPTAKNPALNNGSSHSFSFPYILRPKTKGFTLGCTHILAIYLYWFSYYQNNFTCDLDLKKKNNNNKIMLLYSNGSCPSKRAPWESLCFFLVILLMLKTILSQFL